jgi:hypothetical protein
MICRDFEQLCQELLDARGAAVPSLDARLEVHATDCPVCQSIYLRYQILRQAIRVLPAAPSPPAGFVERCLSAYKNEPVSLPLPFRLRPLASWAAAAAVLVVSLLAVRTALGPKTQARPDPASHGTETLTSARPLTESLADATSATWDLARQTSGPAARIGRQVLASAALPQADWPVPHAGEATGVLQSVGSQVEAGVRPLPSTARQAFGFLLPSAPSQRPASKGASNGA